MKVEILYDALYNRYKAKQTEALCNLQMFFIEGVGVAEHPELITSMDNLMDKLTAAEEKLKSLQDNF